MKRIVVLVVVLLFVSPTVLAEKPDPNVPNPPLQVLEHNVDANGWIAVHEQGTASVDIVDTEELDVNITNAELDVNITNPKLTVDVDNFPVEQDVYIAAGTLSPVSRAYYDSFALDPEETLSHTFSGGPILATLIHVSDSDAEGWYRFHSTALAPGGEHGILFFDDLEAQSPQHTISLQYPMELDGFTIYCANESDYCTPHITVVGFAP